MTVHSHSDANGETGASAQRMNGLRRRWLKPEVAHDVIAALLLMAVVAILFAFGAPTDDAFSWPDAPRHALNGAFVLDLLRDHPIHDPTSYAYNYYARYPALTILFYPPLFYVVLAVFYGVLGVSQQSALCAEFACYIALAFGTYRLARFWLTPVAACGAAILLAASPEVAYWGRQVMLEIPAFALVAWSAAFFMHYLRGAKVAHLYVSGFLFVLAVYTKTTSAFMAPVYLIALIQYRGLAPFREWRIVAAGFLSVLMLAPLAALTLKYGQQNMHSIAGIPESPASRLSLAGWLWYARQLPSQMGYVALAAALLGIGIVIAKRGHPRSLSLLFWWFVIGYIFFSAIALKEARHDIFLLLPLSIIAIFGISRLLGRSPPLEIAAIALVTVSTLVLTLVAHPVQYVSGYDPVADYVAGAAPPNSNIVFSGYRDGAFIFAMRAREKRRDISIVRADKLLLNIAIRRERFVEDKNLNAHEIGHILDTLGIRYVVAQSGFWTDLPSMNQLELLLNGPHFRRLRRFPMHANYHAQEKELVVYQNLDKVASGRIRIQINVPTIGRAINGVVGSP
jgi:hypothetical protein